MRQGEWAIVRKLNESDPTSLYEFWSLAHTGSTKWVLNYIEAIHFSDESDAEKVINAFQLRAIPMYDNG